MEAALAEFKAEDIGIDQEEDADFAVVKGTLSPLDVTGVSMI